MTLAHVFSLLGGLGLFLYGMDLMGEGLQNAAGNRLKTILERLTTNRMTGVLVGTIVTMIIQSSSATTVMVVGFVNAGLMNLSQAFGVMLGANIGTTITGQIIALNLSDIAPVFVIIGVIPMMFGKKRSTKSFGQIIAGFGILFTGMGMMSSAMVPLRTSTWFADIMTSFSNPVLGVLIGTLVTAVIQSSSASVGILQALALQGLVSVDAGLYIVIGCNIGTCATALLASIGASTMARRTSILHLLNKIIGAAIFTALLIIVPSFGDMIQRFTPDNPSAQVANFHTVFNILNTVLLLPFGSQLIALVNKLVKSKEDEDEDGRLLYLDEHILETPAIAMVQLNKEITRLAEKIIENTKRSLSAFFDQDEDKMLKVIQQEKVINFLGNEITTYIVRIQRREAVGKDDQSELFEMHGLMIDLERVGDHAENIAEYAGVRLETHSEFTPDALFELRTMSDKAMETLQLAVETLSAASEEKEDLRERCLAAEDEVDILHEKLRENHIRRLNRGNCTPRAGMIFTDMAIDLERIADHAINIAGLNDEHGFGTLHSLPPASSAPQQNAGTAAQK